MHKRKAIRNKILTKYYVLFVESDIEPSLLGPYKTQKERDAKAKELKVTEDGYANDENGIFWMDVTNGVPKVGVYGGGFFEDK